MAFYFSNLILQTAS